MIHFKYAEYDIHLSLDYFTIPLFQVTLDLEIPYSLVREVPLKVDFFNSGKRACYHQYLSMHEVIDLKRLICKEINDRFYAEQFERRLMVLDGDWLRLRLRSDSYSYYTMIQVRQRPGGVIKSYGDRGVIGRLIKLSKLHENYSYYYDKVR